MPSYFHLGAPGQTDEAAAIGNVVVLTNIGTEQCT